MAEITIQFSRCIQDSQEWGSDDSHMVSRVFFTVERDGDDLGEYFADLKQTVGSDPAGDIEVTHPSNDQGQLSGPFAHQAFSNVAKEYFRRAISQLGIEGEPVGRIRMRHNVIGETMTSTFDASDAVDD